MNRILTTQIRLLNKIASYENQEIERDYPLDWERIHMVSCAKIGQILAIKRHVNPELAAIACALHDFGRIVTGKQADHAVAGYQPLKVFLDDSSDFTAAEIEALAYAAKNHSNKQEVGTPLEEVVKDADVLDCYQYGQPLERQEQRERLGNVLSEVS
jgi:uncharacterized protein